MSRRIGIVPALLAAFSCAPAPRHERVQWLMGTYARIVVREEDASVVDSAFERLRRVDAELSPYREDSFLTRVNAAAGVRPVRVPAGVAEAVELSLRISDETRGAFDPTLGALTLDAYGFARDAVYRRADGAVRRVSKWGYKKVELQGGSVFLTERGVKLDLGGIGKGFALDEAARVFRSKGVGTYLVALGGDQRMRGHPWRVVVQDPRAERPFAWFRTDGGETCVSTSGDYRRGFYSGGEWIHHVLDPRSGLSAGGFRSVTLVGPPPCSMIDAAATAVFVMGESAGLRYLSGHPAWSYLLITSTGGSVVRDDSPVRFHVHGGKGPP